MGIPDHLYRRPTPLLERWTVRFSVRRTGPQDLRFDSCRVPVSLERPYKPLLLMTHLRISPLLSLTLPRSSDGLFRLKKTCLRRPSSCPTLVTQVDVISPYLKIIRRLPLLLPFQSSSLIELNSLGSRGPLLSAP